MFCLQLKRNIHQHFKSEFKKSEPAECMASQSFAKMSVTVDYH